MMKAKWLFLLLFFAGCTVERPFPYIEKAVLGKTVSAVTYANSTRIKTDSIEIIVEGKHTIPPGLQAVYFRQYPRAGHNPHVLFVGNKKYSVNGKK